MFPTGFIPAADLQRVDLGIQLCRTTLLVLRDRRQFEHPRARRAEPVLLFWRDLVALAQGSDTQHVALRIGAGGGGIDWRAALRTERLQSGIAILRRRLEVERRLAA